MGDANLDFTADGSDFIIWNDNRFDSGTAWCTGDFNADGFTDASDFIIWNANRFQSAAPPSGQSLASNATAATALAEARELPEQLVESRSVASDAPSPSTRSRRRVHRQRWLAGLRLNRMIAMIVIAWPTSSSPTTTSSDHLQPGMTNTKPHAAEVAECMRRIYAQRLTTTSGGNVSVRDDAGAIWVSGSGIDKATIAEQHVICVHPDGSRHPATANLPTQPSSELPFHRAIYAARADIHAIIHAHPPALVAATLIHRVPDLRLIPSAYLMCGEVGWTDYCTPGTGELGARLATVFAQGYNAALMQNHGVVVAAADLATALCRFETLEFTARSIDLASEFGDPIAVTPESLAAYQQAFARRGLDVPQPAPPSDIADNVCEIMRRGYERHLMSSGRGSISARTRHDAFVVSTIGVDFAETSRANCASETSSIRRRISISIATVRFTRPIPKLAPWFTRIQPLRPHSRSRNVR